MADRREEVSGGSPSKRPKLDHDEPFSSICSSNGEPEITLSNEPSGSKTAESKGANFPSNRDPTSSTSDRGEGSVFGSASGAVFENQGRETDGSDGMNDSLYPCETSGVDQNVTDSSFLTLHDTLADISAIPSCSQTLSTSQISSASAADDSQRDESSSSLTPGRDNEPSSSQISDESGAGVVVVAGGSKPSGSASGSSSSSPNANQEGAAADDDDSDLELGLGNWTPELPAGPMGWLQRQMLAGVNPRSILKRMLPRSVSLPDDMDEFELWSLILDYFKMLQEPRRKKLDHMNTFSDALRLLQISNRILVLTGAGVSVSCGIPDFRSRDGVYARLAVDFPDLPDPQAMFDIHYFKRDPRPFFKFAKEIYPGQFRPSINHKFISVLEQQGKLLRNYTQNIDTLEQVAGISRVVQCHGSFATAKCTNCSYKVDADAIREDIFNQVVPLCPKCPQGTEVLSVMKPEIVFFGEGLPNEFYHSLEDDKEQTDLLIVIGSSLKVRPVATIPNMIPANIPQILINREPLRHMTFDIELLGDGDVIINELCRRLGDGWSHICNSDTELQETLEMPESPGTAADRQAKMEFENAPTPPVLNQDSNSNQPTPSDSKSHLVEAAAINIADGVSSSSDAACMGKQPDADTNEAEPAKHRLTVFVKSARERKDENVPLETKKDNGSNGANPSETSNNANAPSTSSNAAQERPNQVNNGTVEQSMTVEQSKSESSKIENPLPNATKESNSKNNTSSSSHQVAESSAAVTSHSDGTDKAGDDITVESSTSGATGGSTCEPGQSKNEVEPRTSFTGGATSGAMGVSTCEPGQSNNEVEPRTSFTGGATSGAMGGSTCEPGQSKNEVEPRTSFTVGATSGAMGGSTCEPGQSKNEVQPRTSFTGGATSGAMGGSTCEPGQSKNEVQPRTSFTGGATSEAMGGSTCEPRQSKNEVEPRTSFTGGATSGAMGGSTCEPGQSKNEVEPRTSFTGGATSGAMGGSTCEPRQSKNEVEPSTSGTGGMTGDGAVGGSTCEPGQSKNADSEAQQQQKKRRRSSIGTYLLPSTYLFVPPNRYIFHGAEVYPPFSPECSDDEDAEPHGPRLDSSSDLLGLDSINPSHLDTSGDLSDPFDPDPGSHQPTTFVSSRGEALSGNLQSSSVEQGLMQGNSLMSVSPSNLPIGLADDSHIPLSPLVLSDAVESILPTVDHVGQVDVSNVNSNHSTDAENVTHAHHHNQAAGSSTHHHHPHPHSHQQPGGTSHDPDFEFHVRYKHERDDIFTNTETARDNYEHRTDMSLPSISSNDVVSESQTIKHDNAAASKSVSHPGAAESHDQSCGSSHDHKQSGLPNGSTQEQSDAPEKTVGGENQLCDTGS